MLKNSVYLIKRQLPQNEYPNYYTLWIARRFLNDILYVYFIICLQQHLRQLYYLPAFCMSLPLASCTAAFCLHGNSHNTQASDIVYAAQQLNVVNYRRSLRFLLKTTFLLDAQCAHPMYVNLRRWALCWIFGYAYKSQLSYCFSLLSYIYTTLNLKGLISMENP